jgi:type II secretory pathway pseudopilin PulG
MKIFQKQKINQPAFTLIEIIIVIGIFVGLISVTIVNYRSGSRQSQLLLAAQELAANIRLAQNYAIGSKDFVDPDDPTFIQSPQGGWGIYASLNNPNYYQIVVDLNGDHSKDEVFRTINLPNNVVIEQIKDNSGIVNDGTVFFEPPNPQTFINNEASNQIVFILKDEVEITTIQITVNFFGLVEVKQNE